MKNVSRTGLHSRKNRLQSGPFAQFRFRPLAGRVLLETSAVHDLNPHLGMFLHVLGFAVWSSLWPRNFLKDRLEPVMGWVGYRFFYNFGVIFLLGASVLYLAQKNPESIILWDFRGEAWFRPLIQVLMGLCVLFLYAVIPMGLSFWGLWKPPEHFELLQTGIYRVTRHPLYVAVFFMLVAKTLVFGSVLALIWSGGMLLYNILGVWFLETPSARKQWGAPFEAYEKRVSWVPFLSIIQGKEKLVWSEFSWKAVAGLAGTYCLLFFAHPILVKLIYTLPRLGYVTQWFADRLF